VCRLRPMNEREKKDGTVPAATASSERKEVSVVRHVAGGTRQVRSNFHFDDVLASFSTQEEVYHSTLAPLVGEVLAGYEATAFAYGQTGTGKTYTMEGNLDCDEDRGLVPRAAAAVISALQEGDYADYTVTVSYLEIYNEELSDLLTPVGQQQRLDLKDGGGNKVVCTGLSEVQVNSVEDILGLVHRAQERRRVAETRINARSSRSHSIFTMKVRCRKTVLAGELENTGKLHLVDLAGSECAKKSGTGPEDVQLSFPKNGQGSSEEERERKSINQSLLTLGRVIAALRDGSGRIPYRDSKLTRLLQDALGGHCQTVIIATISPAMGSVDETISTLSYSEQALGIKNRPVASSLLRTIRLAGNGDVAAGSSAGGGATSNDFAELELKVAYLTQEVEEAQAALARKYKEAQEQADRALCAEDKLAGMEEEVRQARLSAEESAFIRERIAAFADGQHEAAGRLSVALDASTAYGEVLAARLAASRATFAASRKQAQELCVSGEAAITLAAVEVEKCADETTTAVAETHAAHRAATGAAAEVAQEQQRIINDLSTKLRSGAAQLNEFLVKVAADAEEALEMDQTAAIEALDAIAAAAASAGAAAAKAAAEAAATALADGEAARQRAEALRMELASGREAISALAEKSGGEAGEARTKGERAHTVAMEQAERSIRQPLAGLQYLLQAATRHAESHTSEAVAAHEQSTKEAKEASQRRCCFLAAATEAAKVHGATTTTRPLPLREALEALQTTLESRAGTVSASLVSMERNLCHARTNLEGATAKGKKDASEAVADAHTRLTTSWEEETGFLEELQTLLTRAAEAQRAGNAGEAVKGGLEEASVSLVEALAAAVKSLAVTRENIAGQIAELQEQRAAEQEIAGILTKQREELQADTATVAAALEASRAELASNRDRVASLQAAQEQRRARALEAITSTVASELESLGVEFGAGAEEVSKSLDSVVRHATSAGEATESAEKRNTSLGLQVAGVAEAWSKSVGLRCGAIGAAQERSREAAEAIEGASAAAEQNIAAVGILTTEWRGCCEGVARTIDEASGMRGRLRAAQEAVMPRWQSARSSALEAVQAWAEGGRAAVQAMEAADDVSAAARAELSGLCEEAASRHTVAVACVGDWEKDADEHSSALKSVLGLGAEADLEDGKAEERRSNSCEALSEAARDLEGRARQAREEVGVVLEAVAAQAVAMPVDFRAGDAALSAAAEALEALSAQAGSAFDSAAKAVSGLEDAYARTLEALREQAAEGEGSVAASTAAGTAAVVAQREAVAAAGGRARGRWRRAEAERDASVKAAAAAMEVARETAAAAALAGNERMLAELEKGVQGKELATSSVKRLASDAKDALAESQAAWKRGLAEEPLGAFEASPGSPAVPPRPRESLRPHVDLPPKPDQEQLALEFRQQKQDGAFQGAENAGANSGPTPVKCLSKELEATSDLNSEGPCRRVLGDVMNRMK